MKKRVAKQTAESMKTLKRLIVERMGKLTLHERRVLYRYAYIVIEASAHRRDPEYIREPIPPADCLADRTRSLLEAANREQVAKVLALEQKMLDAKKKKKA